MQKVEVKAEVKKKYKDEDILVVRRDEILKEKNFKGVLPGNYKALCKIIDEKKEFLKRADVEDDPTYKQIIPYLIFQYKDKFFLMQRSEKASEKRLQSLFSLGIGGHIRKDDMSDKGSILSWAEREFEEEVSYSGNYKAEYIGLLNDDSNSVGEVHIGAIFVLKGDSEKIFIKDEHKSGELKTLVEIKEKYDSLENWSKMVLDQLKFE